ncbi:MAG: CBS domain-containing protein [Desulfobacterales bacterium]|nr:CBS domain-containing protein [Desulfobacterales bacterium]
MLEGGYCLQRLPELARHHVRGPVERLKGLTFSRDQGEPMFVSRSMTRRVVTVGPKTSIFEAQELMTQNRVRHLPVVEEGDKLVGIVSDRDLRSALPFRYFKEGISPEEKAKLEGLQAKDIMTRKVFTISPGYTIQDALLMIQNAKVGALPVVDDEGRLKGILLGARPAAGVHQRAGDRPARDPAVHPGRGEGRAAQENRGRHHRDGRLLRQRPGGPLLGRGQARGLPLPAHPERGPRQEATAGDGLHAARSRCSGTWTSRRTRTSRRAGPKR